MKLTMRKSEWMDDWYVIERAEHDGREWLEPTGPNVVSFRCSSRIGDASVEGTADEMLAIASAIEKRVRESFKRCAVSVNGEEVRFWSPRNSVDRGDPCTLAEADELAAEIRQKLEPKP